MIDGHDMDKVYEIIEWIRQNWLVTLVVAYVIGIMLYCHFKGFIHTALGVCTAILSVLLTGLAGKALDRVLPSVIGDSETALLAAKILCLIVIFILMRHVMHLIIEASDALMSLPVLHGLDQIAGAIAGFIFALVFVWLVGTVIAVFDGQGWVQPFLEQIDKSTLLTWLHEHNMILEFFRGIQLF